MAARKAHWQTQPQVSTKAKPRGSQRRLTVEQVDELLEREYNPVQWKPRYDPISELVFTILSQHTSDVNSEKAFNNLWNTFGSWDVVADTDPETIAQCRRYYMNSITNTSESSALLRRQRVSPKQNVRLVSKFI